MIWMGLVFGGSFILLFPVFLIFMFTPKYHKYLYGITKFVGSSPFYAALIDLKVIKHPKIKVQNTYIYCANHTSYLDIPLIASTVDRFTCFVGKQDLVRVPLFGLMFRNVHIPIDRDSRSKAYKSMLEAKKRLKLGQNICIFPQGGIRGKGIWLTNFKDGPFRLALETGIPIVPVTIPYNWCMLGRDFKFSYQKRVEIIYHEPIETSNLAPEKIKLLKKQTYNTVAKQLELYFPEIIQPSFLNK